MCEQYQDGIEHPNQSWYLPATADQMDESRKAALDRRYAGISPAQIAVPGLIDAVNRVTQQIHSYRATHELANRARLGIIAPTYDTEPSQLWLEYDNMTGRAEKVGHFVSWFSHVSHMAYVSQEGLEKREQFVHVSLELGGKRQYGDWEATKEVDGMAKSIPRRLLEAEPLLEHMTVFGESTSQRVEHEKVKYIDDVPKSYMVIPLWQSSHSGQRSQLAGNRENIESSAEQGDLLNDYLTFEYLKIRRRRPVADVFIKGQSDVVIFKESWGLIPLGMLEQTIRNAILADIQKGYAEAARKYREERRRHAGVKEPNVKIQDTPGARLAGRIFETAIKSGHGETKDIIPIEAHYLQAVGEKYSLHRDAAG